MSSSPKAIQSLKRLSRSRPPDTASILRSMEKESDAGAVLLCSGLVEDALYELLIKSTVALSKPDHSALFDGIGPLATFSSRINVSYCFGLIGPHTRDNLNIVREIRNAFAHSKTTIGFSTPEVVAVCRLFDFKHLSAASKMVKSTDLERMKFSLVCIDLWGALGGASIARRMPHLTVLP